MPEQKCFGNIPGQASANGKVLIEGAGFTCQLSPARWKISEEAHRWNLRWKERECAELRREIRILTHEFEEPNVAASPSPPSPVEAGPPSS